MANTFKFGNNNWAVKDGQALAYNDENNNFKPLPFEFTRASTATRVNRQGLVEVVPSGKPRIDFLDNTKGHLLLEPSRTNRFIRSEEFDNSTWIKTRTTIQANEVIAPDGTLTADELREDTQSGAHYFYDIDFNSDAETTFSIFAKYKGNGRGIALSWASATTYFDLENGVIENSTNDSAEMIAYPNGWYRCIITDDPTSQQDPVFYIYKDVGDITYQGDGNSGIYIWGAQAEFSPYATSYIPTGSTTVTRAVDDIELSLPTVDSFSSSSGFSVIAKFDIGATSGSSSVPFLFFNDDSSSTYIGFGSNATNLRCRLNLSGTSYLNTQANAPRTQKNSLFISCDSSGWSQGANGQTNHTGTNNASIFNRLASITFITSETYGIIKISELLVYNTRLSNTELQNLTS